MPRPDLRELRGELRAVAELTRRESRTIQYWSEARLRETLALYEGIAEAEAEYERDDVEDFYDVELEPEPDYGEDFDYDDGDIWEVEATYEYGDD